VCCIALAELNTELIWLSEMSVGGFHLSPVDNVINVLGVMIFYFIHNILLNYTKVLLNTYTT
jgi:hypothetical protein